MWSRLLVLCLLGTVLDRSHGQTYPRNGPLIPTYHYPSATPSGQAIHPQPNTYLAYHHHHHPNPSYYHQNVYLAQSAQPAGVSPGTGPTGPAQSSVYYAYGAPSGSANLYSGYGPSGGANPGLMVASSSSQPVMTAIPPPAGHQAPHETKPGLGSTLAQDSPQAQSSNSPGDQMTSSSGPSNANSASAPSAANNGNPPLGIVFGRPMSGYDGNFYVPVFYPISWMMNSDPMAYASTSTASTMTSPYASQVPSPQYGPLQMAAYFPSPANQPQPQYNPHHAHSGAIYRVMSMAPGQGPQPPQHHHNNIVRSYQFSASGKPAHFSPSDEMMPGDVTPDLNGNFKRSAEAGGVVSPADDPNSYFFADPSTLLNFGFGSAPHASLVNTMQPASRSREGQLGTEAANSYYYLSPYIKFRDPKDDLDLAIEAGKEQLSAQKRFEKEVLMADDLIPGSSVEGKESPLSGHSSQESSLDETSNFPGSNFTNGPYGGRHSSIRIESRSSKDISTPPPSLSSSDVKLPKVKSVSDEPPIMTSIEIYDLPGANKYLGLSGPIASPLVQSSPSNQSEASSGGVIAGSVRSLPQSSQPSKFFKRKLSPPKEVKS